MNQNKNKIRVVRSAQRNVRNKQNKSTINKSTKPKHNPKTPINTSPRNRHQEQSESLLIFDDDETYVKKVGKKEDLDLKKPVMKETKQKVTITKTKKISKSKVNTSSNDIFKQSIDMIYQCDPDQTSSKEELIERLEYKLGHLKSTDVQNKDIEAIEHVLSHLKEEFREEKLTDMNKVRSKQDYIVKKNKLKPEHFKGKTNLTPDSYKELGEDEQLKIMLTSKKFFEKVRDYQKPPKTVINPFSKGKNRGNRRPPADILHAIENKFTS